MLSTTLCRVGRKPLVGGMLRASEQQGQEGKEERRRE